MDTPLNQNGLAHDAAEFARTLTPDSPVAQQLSDLLAADAIPIDRSHTWHAVASVLVAVPGASVLLARNKQGWGTAGGHIEPEDASIRSAAAREAAEEIGLTIDPAVLIPLVFLPDVAELRPGHAHLDFCYLHLVDAPVTVTPASDVTEAQWFALDRLPEVNDHIHGLLDVLIRAVGTAPAAITIGAHTGPADVTREAVRAIVVRDSEVLMLRSASGDCKFPGGGVEPGEDDVAALARELAEECGRDLVSSTGPVLVATERRAERDDPGRVFEMVSRYYACTVTAVQRPTSMSGYEVELGLTPQWIRVESAHEANVSRLGDERAPWIRRELAVLEYLLERNARGSDIHP